MSTHRDRICPFDTCPPQKKIKFHRGHLPRHLIILNRNPVYPNMVRNPEVIGLLFRVTIRVIMEWVKVGGL